jgi:cellulose biosynthesis protein BcsQ
MYWNHDEQSPKTIIDLVNPIEMGEAAIDASITPILASQNRFSVDLLAGHPRMSIVEDLLSRAWGEAAGGDIGGIRRTNWAAELVAGYADRYDVVFFDVGPSLGSLNRTVLLGTDYFVTPMGADIFSIVGIRNITEWLAGWLSTYKVGLDICENSRHPGMLSNYGISTDTPTSAQFAGYTVQQYITKSKQGVRRPTAAFEQILEQIPEEIERSLGPYLANHLSPEDAKLGDVPNMYSLIPLAQSVNAPIAELQSGDGLAGGQYRQQGNYAGTIEAVSNALARNIRLSTVGPGI